MATRKSTRPVSWHDGDYPSAAALTRLKKWEFKSFDEVSEALDFVASIWHWPDFGVSYTLRPEELQVVGDDEADKFLRLATGGWSGNEDIINAMDRNWCIAHHWCMSAAGGLHIYRYPKPSPSKDRF